MNTYDSLTEDLANREAGLKDEDARTALEILIELGGDAEPVLLEEFEELSTAEQQQNLSILWACQPYRSECSFAWHLTCGKRTEEHEKRKGRSGDSVHLWGAVDITTLDPDNLEILANLFKNKWIGGFKHYGDKRFIHADIWKNRRW